MSHIFWISTALMILIWGLTCPVKFDLYTVYAFDGLILLAVAVGFLHDISLSLREIARK